MSTNRLRNIPLLTLLLVFIAAVSSAQQQSNDTSGRATASLAISFASEKLWIWQNRLSLKDWNISVMLARITDLKPNTLGNIRWDPEIKVAVIRILDPADYWLPQDEMLKDMEFTVVHELIHLTFAHMSADFRRTEADRREQEQAVNQIADALLKLDRDK